MTEPQRRPKQTIKGARAEFKGSQSYSSPPEEVFPMLCPVREYEYIPPWECEIVYLFILASVEAVAAILFVIPVTLRVGGISLCLVFFVAFTAHAIVGEFELGLLVYGAGTVFILFHGAGYSHRTLHHRST